MIRLSNPDDEGPSGWSALTKNLDPDSELFREDVDHLNLRLRDE
jgi:hypothetical protein